MDVQLSKDFGFNANDFYTKSNEWDMVGHKATREVMVYNATKLKYPKLTFQVRPLEKIKGNGWSH